MTNEMHNVTDHQMPPNALPQPLRERLLELADADLRVIQGQGTGEFTHSFDNAFKNGFKNVAEW